jgi:tripartite-type tricarboxylate transporter receptor subunit TctC
MKQRLGLVRSPAYPLLALLATLLWCVASHAQDGYPAKPIRMIVTTAAGGAGDLVARAVADRLSESMRQPIIIENLPTGNGILAGGQVAKAAPDGYTLMIAVDSMLVINPHLHTSLPYDPFRDFAPISAVTKASLVLLVNMSVKADNLRELIALAKANPGKMTYASTGIGTILNIGMEQFKLMTGTDILHVPYRATTGAMTDLMGGTVDMVLFGVSSARALSDGRRVKILGVSSPQRSPLMPEIPTIAEAGVPGYEAGSWFGLLAPARTPQPIIDRLSQEVKKASTDPRFIAALAPLGMEIIARSPEETLSSMQAEHKKWGELIRSAGIKVN